MKLKSKDLIEDLKDPEFYLGLTQKKLENIREEIRELVQYLEYKGMNPVYTDLEDSDATLTEGKVLEVYGLSTYRKRVESYVREHKHQLTITKLCANQSITADELHLLEEILFDDAERGTRDDFVKAFGEQPLGSSPIHRHK